VKTSARRATKDEAKPTETAEKAHKPASAAVAGPPHKAHKPAAAATLEPHKAHKPPSAVKAAAQSRPKAPAGARKGMPAKPGKPAGGNAKTKPKAGKGSGSEVAKVASVAAPKAGKALVKAATPGRSSLAGRAGWKLIKVIASRALSSGAEALSDIPRDGLERAVVSVGQVRAMAIEATSTSVDADTTRRPPIQAAVDAAVPGRVAWQEWSRLEWLPEGVDTVIDIKRDDDDGLAGHLRGRDGTGWAARILDEREEESFAWESRRGSDCAGLITFHELSERLTRIELSLDVRPVTVSQAAALSTRLADRRAAADLRRFKARLELINPDSYDDSDNRRD
jgi:uncharacterized membrane protein